MHLVCITMFYYLNAMAVGQEVFSRDVMVAIVSTNQQYKVAIVRHSKTVLVDHQTALLQHYYIQLQLGHFQNQTSGVVNNVTSMSALFTKPNLSYSFIAFVLFARTCKNGILPLRKTRFAR